MKCDVGSEEILEEKHEELLHKKWGCEDKLAKLRVVTDRIPEYEVVFNAFLNKQEITKRQKEALLKYIKEGIERKALASDYTNFDSPYFTYSDVASELPNKNSAIWRSIADISQRIGELEYAQLIVLGRKDEYENAKRELNDASILFEDNQKKREIAAGEIEKLRKALNSEFILNLNARTLNELCSHNASKKTKTELMIIKASHIDDDLAAVIKMRATSSHDKGNKLVVVFFHHFKKMMESNQIISGVTKISFLRHGPLGDYTKNISSYINHFPDLQDIVLRGCGTASEERKTNSPPIYKPKISKVPYNNTPSIQGSGQLVIQQQKNADGKILTKVSWNIIDMKTNKFILNTINNILDMPLILEKHIADEQLDILAKVPGMPLLQYSAEYVNQAKHYFFNREDGRQIPSDKLRQIKKVVRRTRTEQGAPDTNYDDKISEILRDMTPEQQRRISVKGYYAGYTVRFGRVFPEKKHDQDKLPKAVRIGPR